MPANVADALSFIVGSIGQLYAFVLILRLLLPWFRADFRNPLAQGILRITSPLVVPLRRVLPSVGRIDTATVVVTFFVLYLTLLLVSLILGLRPGPAILALSAIMYIPLLILRLYIFLIIVRVVLSWVAPQGYNPAIALFYTLTEPVLRPFQRLIPRMGGFDLSPIFAIIVVGALIRVVQGFVPLLLM
jgi:YggT family protein